MDPNEESWPSPTSTSPSDGEVPPPLSPPVEEEVLGRVPDVAELGIVSARESLERQESRSPGLRTRTGYKKYYPL